MSKIINLFVSHKGEDEEKIDAFKELMSNKGYEFRDSSIRESEPNQANNEEYIKQKYLRPAIKWAGTVVVLIGDKTAESDWVNWEIEYAVREGRNVVGVFLPGERNAEIPKALKDFSDTCVGWNSDKIDDAIQNNKRFFEDTDGNPVSLNPHSHGTC